MHPLYDPKVKDFNIAVVTVGTDIDLTKPHVGVVKLPTSPVQFTDEFTLGGWGVPANHLIQSLLLTADLDFVPFLQCLNAYKNFGRTVTNRTLCATQHGRGRDACQGDTGGPLVLKGTNTLVGIVARGNGCGNRISPGEYTDMYQLRNFVRQIEELFKDPFP